MSSVKTNSVHPSERSAPINVSMSRQDVSSLRAGTAHVSARISIKELPIGVLLLDRIADRLYFRIREDMAEVANEDAIRVLSRLTEVIAASRSSPSYLFYALLARFEKPVRYN